MNKKTKFSKIHPAVIAVWAAIIAAANALPSLPIIGGGSFSVATALHPLSGVFFGPAFGVLASALGGFIGQLIAPHTAWMGMITFTVGSLSALTAGLITEGQWKKTFTVFGYLVIGFIVWFASSVGRSAPVLPIVQWAIVVPTTAAIATFLIQKGYLKGTPFQCSVVIWLIGVAGMVSNGVIANNFALYVLELPGEVMNVLAVQGPLERALFAFGTTIIGVPLLIGLPKIGVYVGPEGEEVESEKK